MFATNMRRLAVVLSIAASLMAITSQSAGATTIHWPQPLSPNPAQSTYRGEIVDVQGQITKIVAAWSDYHYISGAGQFEGIDLYNLNGKNPNTQIQKTCYLKASPPTVCTVPVTTGIEYFGVVTLANHKPGGTDVYQYRFYVAASAVEPWVVTTKLPTSHIGTTYHARLRVAGGTAPYSWKPLKQMPAGLSLNRSTGAITGVPKKAGTYAISVQVKDANHTVADNMPLLLVVTN